MKRLFFCCQCYPQFFVIVIGNDYLQGRLCLISPSDSFQKAGKHDLWVAIHLLSFSSLTRSYILAQTDREVMETPSLELAKNRRDVALRVVVSGHGWMGWGWAWWLFPTLMILCHKITGSSSSSSFPPPPPIKCCLSESFRRNPEEFQFQRSAQ